MQVFDGLAIAEVRKAPPADQDPAREVDERELLQFELHLDEGDFPEQATAAEDSDETDRQDDKPEEDP
jgi:hypothetical protein